MSEVAEKFFYEVPTIEREADAIDYIYDFINHNSKIYGTGGLNKYIDNYKNWLNKLEVDYNRVPDEEKVPARTFFLVRESDNKIVGMVNIRTSLNEKLSKYGGHIGYSIRPTERGKGYNKINLYLALKVCDEYGIDKVFMDADLDNTASWKTMEALGGVRVREFYSEIDKGIVVDYNIDVKKSLETYKDVYEPYILDK